MIDNAAEVGLAEDAVRKSVVATEGVRLGEEVVVASRVDPEGGVGAPQGGRRRARDEQLRI